MATSSLAELAGWLREVYAPAAAGTPDGVGSERYALGMRAFLGSRTDAEEAYSWAWDELVRIEDEMASLAEAILPGASIDEAMVHLDAHGEAVVGEDALQRWLQELMDETVAALDGTHFDLAPPLRTVEAMIAPPGTAAAQYYTRADGRLQPSGPDLVPDDGPLPVPDLERDQHLLPRGRPRSSSPARAMGVRDARAVAVPERHRRSAATSKGGRSTQSG